MAFRCVLLAAAFAATAPAMRPASEGEPARLPERLERYVTASVRLTTAERVRLSAGTPVARLLDADPSQEVAVFGAIWIDAPMRAYVESVSDIESHERGGAYLITKRVGSPPRAADFAPLRLPEADVRDLRSCRPGNCDVKLDQAAIDALRARVDFSSPAARDQADAVLRERALALVAGYRARGNAALPVYRDKSEPAAVASELGPLIDGVPPLAAAVPDVRRYLRDYPRAALPDSNDFVYWQIARFGLKPTLRVSHLVIHQRADETIVASKMLYASHYFVAALELRVLTADPARGPGFWLVTISRSRADGLSGLKGLLIRGRVQSRVRDSVAGSLVSTKARLEARRR